MNYNDLLEGEKKYPIMEFRFYFKHDKIEKDLVILTQMLKEEQTQQQLEEFAQNWWNGYVENHKIHGQENVKLKDCNPILEDTTIKYIEHETWCCSWFSHYTLNTHLNNEDLFRSFINFVCRKEYQINKYYQEYGYKEVGAPCLMGAEDRGKWKSPCRCEHCQNQGVVRIDH